jgi:hypothetical protein
VLAFAGGGNGAGAERTRSGRRSGSIS